MCSCFAKKRNFIVSSKVDTVPVGCSLSSSVSENAAMASCYKRGIAERDEYDLGAFPLLRNEELESFFAEQSEVDKEVKLSYMLRRLDDTFSTEDRWPI